jgi:hypothetical protein
MSAADKFFRTLSPRDSVDQRLERIAATSATLHNDLKAGMCRYRLAIINRWVIRHLDLCTRTFKRPAPVELVRLIEHLVGADKPERNGARKNREKFVAAADYVAHYPDATPSKIARAIKYDQKRIIARWLEDPDFQEIAGIRHLRRAHQQKRGT